MIKNPLTIVGIFAGLVEIAGTGVMPFLQPEIQKLYVWFLMFFPALLVVAFFVTLFFRHHVLYAPSDFREDAGFHRWAPADRNAVDLKARTEEAVEILSEQAAAGQLPDHESGLSLQVAPSSNPEADSKTVGASTESAETQRDEPATPFRIPGPTQVRERPSARERAVVESLILRKFEDQFGARFKRDMRFEDLGYVYDAVDLNSKNPIVMEMRYTARGILNKSTHFQYLTAANNVYERLSPEKRANFIFAFVFYSDSSDPVEVDRIKRSVENLRSVAAEFPFKVVAEYFRMQELLLQRTATPVTDFAR